MPEPNAPAPITNGAAEPSMEELAATLFKSADEAAPEAARGPENAEPPAGAAPSIDKKPDAKETPAAPPKDERVAKRIEAATRAELRASASRRELETLQQQLETRRKELDAREARMKLIEADPVRAFEELKLDPKAFLEKLAEEQTPDNVMAKRLSVLEEELKKERETRTQLEHETQRRQRAAQVDSDWKQATAVFLEHVGTNAEKYPHLVAEYTEEEAIAEADRILAEPVTLPGRDGKPIAMTRSAAYAHLYGDYPDNDVIAEHLDKLAKARVEAREKSAWRKRNGEQPAAPSQGSQPGEKEEARTVRGSNPRTLTSRDASERGTAPKPWSQEAADEESERIIKEALGRNR